MHFYSHTKRKKSCNEDSRYPPLRTTREGTSGNHLKNNLQKKWAKPDPDVEAQQDF